MIAIRDVACAPALYSLAAKASSAFKSARSKKRVIKATASHRANILLRAIAKLTTPQPRDHEQSEPQPLIGMDAIIGDDPLAHTCGFLDAVQLETLRTCGRRTRDVAGRSSVWEPVCSKRWQGRRQLAVWRLDAGTDWRRHYALREREIYRKRVPVFAMSAYLELGRRTDLHFFEPRYKWLVDIATRDHGGLFVFCTNAPLVHPRSPQFSWVCEARNVQLLTDGRANLSVFPVARCNLQKLWREPVPGALNAPQLTLAHIEELPASVLSVQVTEEESDEEEWRSESDEEHEGGGTLRLSSSHRRLLELLVHNSDAMQDLGLTHERVQELLRMVGGVDNASDSDDDMLDV